MAVPYQHARGTRAALNGLAGSASLRPGQIYLITDEGRIAIALTTSTYETYVKVSEAKTGAYTNIHVGTTAPSSPTEGDLWVDTT